MTLRCTRSLVCLAALTAATACSDVVLARDIITRRSSATRLSGKITKISRTEVVINAGLRMDKPTSVPVNDIVQIEWDNQPGALSGLRSAESSGRYKDAAEGYEKLLKDGSISNENLKTDLRYFAARARAKMALAGSAEDMAKAVAALKAFRTANPETYHYYELTALMGELQLAGKSYDEALATFRELGKAKWKDVQLASRMSEARVLLAQNKPDDAQNIYKEVLNAIQSDATLRRLENQARLGKAAALQQANQHEAALTELKKVIESANAGESGVLAEAYLLQGDGYRALNRNKDALFAYLHVDLLFARETKYHPKALYYLSQLWAVMNQPRRAGDAKTRLQADYPDSEWAKK